jgi:Protein of unknown function (DUF1236)
MRTRSVITTAASVLLASTVFAAAQGTQKQAPGGEGGGAPAQTQQHEGQQGKQAPQKSERRENGSQKQVQEREGSSKQQQGKQETQKEQRGEPKGKGERNDAAQRNERNDAQRGDRTNDQRERTEGQGQRERNDAQRGERNEGQRGEHKTLTVEQKTKVRETVLRGGNAPRVSSVNFNISVGTVVPTTVRVVELPPVLVEYYPDWRGYFYFVYNDEIIVVDRNHHIVAVLEV